MNKLNELFNSPSAWEWTKNTDTTAVAEFIINGKSYTFSAWTIEQAGRWGVEFSNETVPIYNRFGITHQGDAAVVFATVLEIIRDLVKKREVHSIEFESIEPNRMRLYKRICSTLFPTWKVTIRGEFLTVTNPEFAINEAQLSNADAKAVFADAAKIRDTHTGFFRVFKGLRKEKIDVNDLQKSWQEAGYPDDIRDINAILHKHGFEPNEINKVFSGVFGKDENDQYEEPTQSPVVQKIAKYAKDNGIANELRAFMAQEFGFKESVNNRKAMIEDIRDIFNAIVKEERTGRDVLIKQHEQRLLGRTKK